MANTKVSSEQIIDGLALGGNPTAATQTAGNNSTRLATTAYTDAAVTALIGGAPSTLDTLNEIAAAVSDDPDYVGTVNAALALKAPKASPTFTGTVTTAAISGTTGQFATSLNVDGTATMDGLTVDGATGITVNGATSGNGKLSLVAYAGVQDAEAQILAARAAFSGTNSRLKFLTNNGTSFLTRVDINDIGDISFYNSGGSAAKMVWDASAEALGIGTTSPDAATTIVSANVATGSNGTLGVKADAAAINNGGQITLGTTSARHVAIAGRQEASGGSAGYLQLSTRGSSGDITERMRISSTGNVGINTGTTAPVAKLEINGGGFATSGGTLVVRQDGDAKGDGVALTSSHGTSHRIWKGANGNLNIGPSNIASSLVQDTSGNLLVGKSSDVNTTTGITLRPNGGGRFTAAGTSSFVQLAFFRNGSASEVGSILTTSSATTYATSSDYRLKEDDQPMTGATERVKALRPINFAWKVDGSRVDGFFAHEAQAVVPECATGTKDAMRDEEYEVTAAIEEVRDEDDNITTEAVEAVMGTRSVPDMQGIDQSKLVPLLTAALQEAIARIEILEG